MTRMSGLRAVWSENVWVLPALGVIADVAAFFIAGWVVGTIGLAVLFILIFAMVTRSLVLRTRQLDEVLGTNPQTGLQVVTRDESFSTPEESVAPPGGASSESDVREATQESSEGEASPVNEAIDASFSGDYQRVRKLLIPWIGETDAREEAVRRRALALGLTLRAGDPEARDLLRGLADENPQEAAVVNWLVMGLKALGELTAAIEELEARIPRAGEAKLSLQLLLAATLREASLPERALRITDEILLEEAPTESNPLGRVLAERGYALEQLGRMEEAFGSFESALRANPVQEDVRFHIAYEYGRRGWGELAVIHYEAVLATQPGNHTALNNLGVELRELGMLFLGTERLREGAESDSSLASANLAGHLIEAGFGPEAKSWIDRGLALPDPHQNLAAASQRMDSREEEEIQTLSGVRERGLETRDVVKSFHRLTTPDPPVGPWRFSTGNLLVLAQQGDGEVGGAHGEGQQAVRIALKRRGNLFSVTWRKGAYSPRESEGIAAVEPNHMEAVMKPASGSGALWVLRGWPERTASTSSDA